MEYGFKLCFMASLMLFILNLPILVAGEQQVPCYFIFGDSLVDNGNNNGLATMAKANYPPYGIDFPDGPTGRFTNGRNMADIIGQLLGFDKFIPPFATARGHDILRGVNYGSGGAGIRAETGRQLGGRLSMDIQLLNHHVTISRIRTMQRNASFTKEYLSKCIYTVGMGNNDYINNYLMPQFYPSSHLYTPSQFASLLIHQYSNQLKTLHEYGARKVAVFGAGLIGCIPAELGANGSACVDSINNAVQLFNDQLLPLVNDLNNNLIDAKFTYINMTSISSGDPSAAGITVLNSPCCMVSTNYAKGMCLPNSVPCSNRTQYAFLDAYHPTEIVNLGIAVRAYIAQSPPDACPFDIRSLAQL